LARNSKMDFNTLSKQSVVDVANDFSSNDESRIYLPFIIVNTQQQTVIECEVSGNYDCYYIIMAQLSNV
jgi:hypothetical protein